MHLFMPEYLSNARYAHAISDLTAQRPVEMRFYFFILILLSYGATILACKNFARCDPNSHNLGTYQFTQ